MFNLVVFLLVLLFPLYSVPQDLHKDVEKIINSVSKNSEKPRIDQDNCCPACPENKKIKKGEQCSEFLSLKNGDWKAMMKENRIVYLSGKIYELISDLKSKEIFIISKELKIKYFVLGPDFKDFVGEIKIPSESPDKKFVREYEKLEGIFSDIRFKELCEYLGANQDKYAKLK